MKNTPRLKHRFFSLGLLLLASTGSASAQFFTEDWESYPAGTLGSPSGSGWISVNNSTDMAVVSSTLSHGGGKSIFLSDTLTGGRPAIRRTLSTAVTSGVIEFWVMEDPNDGGGNDGWRVDLSATSSPTSAIGFYRSGNSIYLGNPANTGTQSSVLVSSLSGYDANGWNNFRLEYTGTTTSGTITAFLNNTQILQFSSVSGTSYSINRLEFYAGYSSGTTDAAYFDDISFSAYTAVPEPAAASLMTAGCVLLTIACRRIRL